MAQGQIKKARVPSGSKNANRKQQGARVIKPKKATALKQHQQLKKHSSGLTTMTEKSLASKAGHLELLRGGKKDRKMELDTKAGGATKTKK